MYSYEGNVVCDHCGDKCVTGEPFGDASAAIESAIKVAKRTGWNFADGKWACSDCVVGEEAIQQNETKG